MPTGDVGGSTYPQAPRPGRGCGGRNSGMTCPFPAGPIRPRGGAGGGEGLNHCISLSTFRPFQAGQSEVVGCGICKN